MVKALHRLKLKRIMKEILDIDPSREENKLKYLSAQVKNEAYNRRNTLIKHAISEAIKAGYKAGYGIHNPIEDIVSGDWEPEYGVVAFIFLPTGQVTWHIDGCKYTYDGHTDPIKWCRVMEFLTI